MTFLFDEKLTFYPDDLSTFYVDVDSEVSGHFYR